MKRAEDMMREDWEFLKDFNAAVDALQKRQEEFQVEQPAFGSRYSQSRAERFSGAVIFAEQIMQRLTADKCPIALANQQVEKGRYAARFPLLR